jgi:hypothetical protein
MTISARYANAAGTDVALEIDGATFAVKPDDPRLDGVEIGAYQPPAPPPPPPQPTRAELRARLEQIAAQIAALEGDAP